MPNALDAPSLNAGAFSSLFGPGFTLDGTEVVPNYTYLQSRIVYNVMDPAYGATGNGSTADTAAIMAAIAACPEGGTVYLPEPSSFYLIDGAGIVFTKRINFRGAGVRTMLKRASNGPVLTIGDGAAGRRGYRVQDMTLAHTNAATSGDALYLNFVHSSVFENIYVPSCPDTGIHLDAGCLLNTFINCHASTNLPFTGTSVHPKRGIWCAANSNANTFIGCTEEGITTSPGVGIDLDGDNNHFLGGASEGNTIGVRWGSGVHHNLVAQYMESNSGGDTNGTRGQNSLLSGVGINTHLVFGDGTAAVPSISFGSDPDTGLRRIGTNNPSIVAGGNDIIDVRTDKVVFNQPVETTSLASVIPNYHPAAHPLKPTAALYERFSRIFATSITLNPLSTGRLTLTGIYLPAGVTVSSISFVSGSTGATNPTNQWFALYNSSRALLRQTVDDTTTAWGTNALKTLALSSSFVTTYSGWHYLGIMVKADTVPFLHGIASNTAEGGFVPIVTGHSTTGLTTTAPDPAAALTNQNENPYAYVS